ncbi:FHA domain-containing protein, partial [Kocuria indica]|nr:FHA domain-containing protein [Kocuria indica]
MSELTVTLLRYGFLALLWIFIAAVVFSQARDLTVGGKARAAVRGGREKLRDARAREPRQEAPQN